MLFTYVLYFMFLNSCLKTHAFKFMFLTQNRVFPFYSIPCFFKFYKCTKPLTGTQQKFPLKFLFLKFFFFEIFLQISVSFPLMNIFIIAPRVNSVPRMP